MTSQEKNHEMDHRIAQSIRAVAEENGAEYSHNERALWHCGDASVDVSYDRIGNAVVGVFCSTKVDALALAATLQKAEKVRAAWDAVA